TSSNFLKPRFAYRGFESLRVRQNPIPARWDGVLAFPEETRTNGSPSDHVRAGRSLSDWRQTERSEVNPSASRIFQTRLGLGGEGKKKLIKRTL
ncbi:hypothetical protein OAF46_03630, partial [Akkermansiaceae bacterium]|nr:hypothetical protein [Akkermansiaceae bacterium]